MCERCDADKWIESRQVKMSGGRHAKLCNDCLNEWHKLFWAHSVRSRFDDATATKSRYINMEHAGKDVSKADYRELINSERLAEEEAFALSGEFMAPITRNPQPDCADTERTT